MSHSAVTDVHTLRIKQPSRGINLGGHAMAEVSQPRYPQIGVWKDVRNDTASDFEA